MNIWEYIERENIPVIPLYFANEKGERYRSIGCYPCTVPDQVAGPDGARDHRGTAPHAHAGARRPRAGPGKRGRLREAAPRRLHVSATGHPSSRTQCRRPSTPTSVRTTQDRHRRPCGPRQVHLGRPAVPRHRLAAGGQAGATPARSPSAAACRSSGPTSWTPSRPSATRTSPSTPRRSGSAPPKRHYVIIDAPGHKEFLKNMVTGAARPKRRCC